MKGFSELFFRLLQLAFFVGGALAIFFTFLSYNITVYASGAEREAFILGNTLLSSQCLTESDTKGLFSEQKLEDMETDSSCLNYPNGNVIVKLLDSSDEWNFVLGTFDKGKEATFSVSVKLNSGEVKPANMVVIV